jgi:G6PDH family F420-dependent oxidoreductase
MKLGYFLSSEENAPAELVRQAQLAEESGFHALWISDHYHPWIDEQGHSPFVWSVIGALSQATQMRVTTGVTCPTVRIHPAVIAQAAATSAVMLEGRFQLGVGSGEALNEHVVAARWPTIETRLEMLEEAVEVIRELWKGGSRDHFGKHYTVEDARIYDLPDELPPILVSGFGKKSVQVAARIGDGYCTTSPDPEMIELYRNAGGKGPVQAGTKVCFAHDEGEARKIAHRLWPNEQLPGELAQVLPSPAHFEQATELVTEDMVAEAVPCGPDLDRHVEALEEYAQAGVDELFVQNIGPYADEFFETYGEVVSRFNSGRFSSDESTRAQRQRSSA